MSFLCSMRLVPKRNQLWMLGMDQNEEAVLKARLPLDPLHPRALITVLEGLALWSGHRLPVALGVSASSVSSIAALLPDGPAWMSPLVDIQVLDHPTRSAKRRLRGVGDFRDVLRLTVQR
jgi:hypothetical protein